MKRREPVDVSGGSKHLVGQAGGQAEGTPRGQVGGREQKRNIPLATAGLVLALGAAPLLAFACSTNETGTGFVETEGATSTTTTTSGSGTGSAGGGEIFEDAGLGAMVAISPINPILKVEVPLTGQSVQFTCSNVSSGDTVNAAWSLSRLDLGTITQTGLFTPSGDQTGDVTITCNAEGNTASTKLKVLIHALDNQGGVTQTQQDTLRGPPGTADAQWQFLYPYDGTVFPRGILAPEIHLTAGSAPSNTFYVHIVLPEYEYEGFYSGNPSGTQLQMSQDAWEAMTNSAQGATVEVNVAKLYNGVKYGPIFRKWTLANGNLHGTIYYNTYDSPLAGQTGALMRIKGNSPTPEVLVGNCTVCHSVSADGSTAAAANHSGQGGTFDLTGGQLNPPIVWQDSERAAFAALYPKNGDVLVTNATPGYSYPPNTPGSSGPYASDLRTKAGTVIPNSGIEPYYAMTPVFSHDGTQLAFNDRNLNNTTLSTLSVLDYDAVNQKFSNYQVLTTPQPGHHLAWPAFTPDGKWVVYQDGTGEDLATWSGNTGKIYAIDTATKQVTFLAGLNGDGYMPAGTRDENKNYEPTIAPVASGGYFWVMFTSRRTYGNKLTGTDYETKRLWVAAFNPTSPGGVDPTFPAFYIAGQELTSGNSRGFWALDPCKQDGLGCATGDECCNGFCNPIGNPPVFTCGPPDGSCSEEFEACVVKEDCCDPELECIGGKCSQVPPN